MIREIMKECILKKDTYRMFSTIKCHIYVLKEFSENELNYYVFTYNFY